MMKFLKHYGFAILLLLIAITPLLIDTKYYYFVFDYMRKNLLVTSTIFSITSGCFGYLVFHSYRVAAASYFCAISILFKDDFISTFSFLLKAFRAMAL